jgi:hypothetical protein
MAYTVIVHATGETAFLAEMEELPKPTDNVIVFTNPRQKDGKPIVALDEDATIFVYPWARINYLEILGEGGDRDELIEFFRDE